MQNVRILEERHHQIPLFSNQSKSLERKRKMLSSSRHGLYSFRIPSTTMLQGILYAMEYEIS